MSDKERLARENDSSTLAGRQRYAGTCLAWPIRKWMISATPPRALWFS